MRTRYSSPSIQSFRTKDERPARLAPTRNRMRRDTGLVDERDVEERQGRQGRYREIEPHGRATLEVGEKGFDDGRRRMEGYRVQGDEP